MVASSLYFALVSSFFFYIYHILFFWKICITTHPIFFFVLFLLAVGCLIYLVSWRKVSSVLPNKTFVCIERERPCCVFFFLSALSWRAFSRPRQGFIDNGYLANFRVTTHVCSTCRHTTWYETAGMNLFYGTLMIQIFHILKPWGGGGRTPKA